MDNHTDEFKVCLLKALTSPSVTNETTEARLSRIYKRWISILARSTNTPDSIESLIIQAAIYLRRTIGINLFRDNDCLLNSTDISKTTKEILKAGDILAYSYIAESQNSFDSDLVISTLLKASDPDALRLKENLRKYVEGVRSFWRESRIQEHIYPLSFRSLRDDSDGPSWLPMGLYDYMEYDGPRTFIKTHPQGLTTPTGRLIPPEIMDFGVLQFLDLNAKISLLINDIYASHHIILRMSKSSRVIDGRRLSDFASIGGILMLAGESFSRHPQYPQLIDNLIGLGRKFLEFIHTASMATGPVGFNLDIDYRSRTAAINCFMHFRYLAPDTENLMTVIENISTSMDQINLAVADRVRLDRGGGVLPLTDCPSIMSFQ